MRLQRRLPEQASRSLRTRDLAEVAVVEPAGRFCDIGDEPRLVLGLLALGFVGKHLEVLRHFDGLAGTADIGW